MSGFAANGRRTNEFILKGASMLNYDAVAVQWADLSYGAELPARYPLAWTASKWRGQGFAKTRRISRGGEELACFTWLDPATAPDRSMQGDHAQVEDDPAALRAALAQARREGAHTEHATTHTHDEARQRQPSK